MPGRGIGEACAVRVAVAGRGAVAGTDGAKRGDISAEIIEPLRDFEPGGIDVLCSECAQLFKVVGESAVEPGEHQIRVEFDYDGGGYGKGGTATLFVDGDSVGEVRVDATVPMIFSLDETTDLGHDTATAVTDDLTVKETTFTGRIRWVQIDVGEDAEDADHYISAEERFRIAMAIQ